jgi:hypothetical protein
MFILTNVVVEDVQNPVWANAEQTAITAEIKFTHLPDSVPVTVDANYDIPYGVELFYLLKDEDYIPIGEYVEPEVIISDPVVQPAIPTLEELLLKIADLEKRLDEVGA